MSVSVATIRTWKEVAELLKQGWHIEEFDVVSPTGERLGAWGNAIKACRDRGLVPKEPQQQSWTTCVHGNIDTECKLCPGPEVARV
jgi:hypothetical protein